MTRSQWRREQRKREAQREAGAKENVESNTNVPSKKKKKEDLRLIERKPDTQEEAAKEKYDQAVAEDEMLTDDFDYGSEPSLDIRVNMVSVLPREFDQITEVEDTHNIIEMEMAANKPACYYVMNNGCIEEQNAFFEQPDKAMKSHLKPFLLLGRSNMSQLTRFWQIAAQW